MADLLLDQNVARAIVNCAIRREPMRSSILRAMSERSARFAYLTLDGQSVKGKVLDDDALSSLGGEAAPEEIEKGRKSVLDAVVGARASGHFPFVIQHGSHVIVLAAFVYHTEAAAFLAPGGDA
jgi:hypothetical protein